MYHPTTRVLTVLELLQSYGELSGAELARRLEVDRRTVRRYITMLQDMGIPVEAERGRSGGYSLRPGFKLPPLMFNDEEALALALSLRVAQITALNGSAFAIEGVIAKIERVLPDDLREEVQHLLQIAEIEVTLAPGIATSTQTLHTISRAIRCRKQIAIRHMTYGGEQTERIVDPYGLAFRVGRWYMVGCCRLRGGLRTFRVDRIQAVKPLESTYDAPSDIDILEHVERAIAATPGMYRIRVCFHAPLEDVRRYIPRAMGDLTPKEGDVLFSCYTQQIGWAAGLLASIPLRWTVLQPSELQEEMRQIAARLPANLGSS